MRNCDGRGFERAQVLSTAGAKIAAGTYGTVKEVVEMYKSGRFAEGSVGSFCRQKALRVEGHKKKS